jgi:hypothetical protein
MMLNGDLANFCFIAKLVRSTDGYTIFDHFILTTKRMPSTSDEGRFLGYFSRIFKIFAVCLSAISAVSVSSERTTGTP